MIEPLDIPTGTLVDLSYDTDDATAPPQKRFVEVEECTPRFLKVICQDGKTRPYAWADLNSVDRTNPKTPPEAFAPLEIDDTPTDDTPTGSMNGDTFARARDAADNAPDASDGEDTGPEKSELPRTGPLPRPDHPDAARAMLNRETFDAPDRLGVVKFWTDEFTSICPRTGQPDYNTITIEYVPGDGGKCIESKALKYYLWSFREHGAFTERLATRIAGDVHFATEADAVRVTVHQQKRGGITLDAVSHRGEPYTLPVEDAPTR